MSSAKPYNIAVEPAQLDDLKRRLENARFPDELDDVEWELGTPLKDVKRLTRYWASAYDWRKTEAGLNRLPNFRTDVHVEGFDPIDLHYLHQRSSSPNAIPLLFVHGWPGSYIEVIKLLPKLTDPNANVSFHVIAPSLPNYGWSAGIRKRGFGLAQYAETCHKLMQSLGYKSYVTQGGDWGFYITRTLGLLYPEACRASHINMVRAEAPSWASHPLLALANAVTPLSEFEKAGQKRTQWTVSEGYGYREIQCTKPQTPGYAVADSPTALLAWILEKLHDWTDDYPWTDDEIITWVSIYWFSTAGPAASFRIYYESRHEPGHDLTYVARERLQKHIPRVKLALCISPKELTILPRNWGRTLGPIVQESQQEKGGHFLAHEQPDAIIRDLRAMFGSGGPCSDVADALRK